MHQNPPVGLLKPRLLGPFPESLLQQSGVGPGNFSGDANTVGLRTTGLGNPGSVVIKFKWELTLESLAK